MVTTTIDTTSTTIYYIYLTTICDLSPGKGLKRLLKYYTAGGHCLSLSSSSAALSFYAFLNNWNTFAHQRSERDRYRGEINHDGGQYVAVKLFNLCKYLHYKLPTRWLTEQTYKQTSPLPSQPPNIQRLCFELRLCRDSCIGPRCTWPTKCSAQCVCVV